MDFLKESEKDVEVWLDPSALVDPGQYDESYREQIAPPRRPTALGLSEQKEPYLRQQQHHHHRETHKLTRLRVNVNVRWHAPHAESFAKSPGPTVSSRLYLLRSSAALSLRKRLFLLFSHSPATEECWGDTEAERG